MTSQPIPPTFPGIAPLENPNRCMFCLIAQDGTPKHGYSPASDSNFFETSLCGGCGQVKDVCDPELLDAYADCGLHLSDPRLFDAKLQAQGRQPIELRLRLNRSVGFGGVILREATTIDEAIAHVLQKILSIDATTSNSRARPIPPDRYQEEFKRTLEDPTTSFWLSSTLEQLAGRDPIDALSDLEAATRLTAKRFEEAQS